MDKNKDKTEVEKLLDRLNKENVEKYGEMCPHCELLEAFCRCKNIKPITNKK